MVLSLEFSNRQTSLDVSTDACHRMLAELLRDEGIQRGEVSVSIVRDDEMHALNREYLAHDYPTDVLSFVLDREADELYGEIIVSADTAVSRCVEFGWNAHDELTLYLLHGALHLVGYKDKTPADREQMRQRERHYLSQFGIEIPRLETRVRAGCRAENRSKTSSPTPPRGT